MVQCLLQPFPELVMEPKRTCLLLTPLLLLLIIWLAEILTHLRKNPLKIFNCFSGSSHSNNHIGACTTIKLFS